MPTYTYECCRCGRQKELFHGVNAQPDVFCERCGGRMRRLIGAGAGLIFKGDGFYATDYASKEATTLSRQKKDDKNASEEKGDT